MDNHQSAPLKVYIQDIFRAEPTENNYVYELFGTKFKNVMIHGVVTSIYNTSALATNLELSDATGSVQIYFDSSKCNRHPSNDTIKDLLRNFTEITRSGDENVLIMSKLLNRVLAGKTFQFTEGSYLSVVGDIFVDDGNCRMISAYDCIVTSVERDVVWLEELKYLYEKFYLWKKE